MSSPAVESFGYLATALSIVQFVPQVRRTLRTRSVAGISAPFWGAACAQAAMWSVYGAGAGLWPSVATNIVLLGCGVLMLRVLVAQRSPLARASVVAAAVAWVAVAIVTALAGTAPAGVGATVVSFFILWPQTWTALRSRDVDGLAPVAWLIGIGATLGWLGYGIGRADARIWVTAGESCLLSGVVFARLLHLRRRAERPIVDSAFVPIAGS